MSNFKRLTNAKPYGKRFAPLSLLQIRLQRSLCLQADFLQRSPVVGLINDDSKVLYLLSESSKESLLKRVKHSTQIIYSSAIAHQIAAIYDLPVEQITEQISHFVLNNTLFSSAHRDHPSFLRDEMGQVALRVMPSGLIQFELEDSAIAAWLDALVHHEFGGDEAGEGDGEGEGDRAAGTSELAISESELYLKVFAVQYAHARCCSLLQLAHREGLIVLDSGKSDPSRWRFVVPQRILWLVSGDQLWLTHPSERQLICQLLNGLDEIFCLQAQRPYQNWLRLAEEISQAFQEMYRDRPLLRDQADTSSDRVWARLGLVMATQRILALVLKQILGIYAPSTL